MQQQPQATMANQSTLLGAEVHGLSRQPSDDLPNRPWPTSQSRTAMMGRYRAFVRLSRVSVESDSGFPTLTDCLSIISPSPCARVGVLV